jgi:hypothetical protein
VDLFQMKLFHHFERQTRHTLLIPFDAWDVALQYALERPFLMSAMLSLAARHLSVLRPEDPSYAKAAAMHLSRTLSLFRREMPNPNDNQLTMADIDAFVATSMLLQFCIWTSTDFCYAAAATQGADQLQYFNGSKDYIWIFASSFKQVLLQISMLAMPLAYPAAGSASPTQSVFLPYLAHYPLFALVEAARISKTTYAAYQEFFAYGRPITRASLDSPPPFIRGSSPVDLAPIEGWTLHGPTNPAEPDPIVDGYVPVIARFCLIMSFLPDAQSATASTSSSYSSSSASWSSQSSPGSTSRSDTSNALPLEVGSLLFNELTNYIVTMPILCHGPFATMVQQEDPHALLLLYHFYRATARLLPETGCWWAQHRARVSERALRARLLGMASD